MLENIEVCRSYSNVEFVLLDYDCPDPRTSKYVCQDLNHCINSGILTYYHFPEGKYFEPSHSRNLAFRLSTGDIICNVDADNFLGHGFARYVASMLGGKRIFLQGPRDGRGLMGRTCVHREHFEAVGGFDERMHGWGAEDADLGRRLELYGVTKKVILPEKFCHTILHDDALRTRHQREPELMRSLQVNRAYLTENMRLGIIKPNGSDFGRGRVLKNQDTWVEV